MTVDTVYEDRVWLDWSNALDPDNDCLTYRVKWWTDVANIQEATVDGNSLEVTGAAVAGDTLEWQVQAIDLWGPGPERAHRLNRDCAAPTPEEPEEVVGGCTSLPLSCS